jgi:hypothetical protein
LSSTNIQPDFNQVKASGLLRMQARERLDVAPDAAVVFIDIPCAFLRKNDKLTTEPKDVSRCQRIRAGQ